MACRIGQAGRALNTPASPSPLRCAAFYTTMHPLIIITTLIVLAGCNLTGKKATQPTVNDSSSNQIDTTPTKINSTQNLLETNPYDSLAKTYVDTTTLKGKRHWIMNQFLAEYRPTSPDYDSLFDLTYDGFKDYVIGYYAQAGTGIKNRIKVYYFNPKQNCYILNQELSKLPNPTFYISQKKITGFYIGNGGGGGGRLEWINGKWTPTKEFDVHNDDDSTKWTVSYPLKKIKPLVIVRPYEMIPPKDILETEIKW